MPPDRYLYRRTNRFLKSYKHYGPEIQKRVDETLESIHKYLETGKAVYGLRVKCLRGEIYESRVNIHIRIAYYKGKDIIKFFCLGNHDDIRACLKNLKQLLL